MIIYYISSFDYSLRTAVDSEKKGRRFIIFVCSLVSTKDVSTGSEHQHRAKYFTREM